MYSLLVNRFSMACMVYLVHLCDRIVNIIIHLTVSLTIVTVVAHVYKNIT